MKKALLLVWLLSSVVVYGEQFHPAKLVFTNGKTSNSLVKIPASGGDKYILIKASESAGKEKISSEELSKITFTPKDSDPVEYVREYTAVNGRQSKNPLWLQVVEKGPVTLYALGSSMMTSRGGSFGHQVSDVTFYAKRANEQAATFVGQYFTQGAMSLNAGQLFRKHAGTYFADCATLAAKIENKEYKVTDMLAVVNDYNRWKKGKK